VAILPMVVVTFFLARLMREELALGGRK